jgi:hypothetical protein
MDKFVRRICFSIAGNIPVKTIAGIAILMLMFTHVPYITQAQSIQFGLFTQQGIQANPVGSGVLNFNYSGTPILSNSNQVISIDLLDEHVAVFEIEASGEQDLTLELVASKELVSGESTIPLNIRFAYSNLGASEVLTARNQAQEIGEGFTTVTIPVLRRQDGPPGPPPTPEYEGYKAPVQPVYLFVYGTLGPVGNVTPGFYEGQIHIYLSYAP